MSNILHYFTEFGGWSWLILGAFLLILEVLIPGIFMLWVGFAAIITGLIALMFPISMQMQLIIFAAAAIACVLLGRSLFKSDSDPSDQPLLNKRGEQLVGQSFSVVEPIVNGRGRIRVGDSRWSVKGPDAKEGALVRVTAVDGNMLIIEPIDEQSGQ